MIVVDSGYSDTMTAEKFGATEAMVDGPRHQWISALEKTRENLWVFHVPVLTAWISHWHRNSLVILLIRVGASDPIAHYQRILSARCRGLTATKAHFLGFRFD